MRRLAARVLFVLLVVGLFGAALAAYRLWDGFVSPGPLAVETVVIIPKGAGIAAVAERLAAAGVIENPTIFVIGARALELGRRFRAGEFAFSPGMSMRAVAEHLVSGKTVVRRITIPEGLLSVDVVRLLEDADGLAGAVETIPADGELLPETYFYSYGDSRQAIIDRMKAAMTKALGEAWASRSPDIAISDPHEAVTLAAVIERETGIAAERRRVSAVFHNRLKRGMRLQSDPTVAYAVTGGKSLLGRPLTTADLRIDSPYNTYEQNGLPPGPIANPGRAALQAAVDPLKSDEYYFVADGTGGHAFARTLQEHNRNVAKWRRYQRSLKP